jgi:hypothetical protein
LAELLPVQERLTTTLIHRFWCRDGYALHADVLPALAFLATLSSSSSSSVRFPSPAVVSGSDLGVIKVLRDLGVLDTEFGGPSAGIKEDDIWTTWEIEAEKKTVLFWERVLKRMNERRRSGEDELQPSEVLVVGDELVARVSRVVVSGRACQLMAVPPS